jgi:hypothetical protein
MSASRVKKYLQCPHSYWDSYENGRRTDAIHLRFGTMMHTVLERWFQEDKDLKEIFDEEWVNANVVEPDFYKDGLEMVEIFEGTHSKDVINIGFEMAFAIDILEDKIYNCESVDFSNSTERKAFLKQLEDSPNPIIFGYIDRIEYDADSDYLRIIDYKTSRMTLTQQEANDDVQLSMYALVAQYMFSDYPNVSLELSYLRHGEYLKTYRTDEELAVFKDWLISVYYMIKADVDHKATLNKYCGWCDGRDDCEAYQGVLNGEIGEDLNLEELDEEEMDLELERVKVLAKILDGRKKEIEKHFKGILKTSDNTPISAGEYSRYTTPNARTKYSPNTIISLFPEDYEKFLTVNKTEVDKVAKDNEELQRILGETGTKHYTEPTLRRRKK